MRILTKYGSVNSADKHKKQPDQPNNANTGNI